ncbi:MAG: hypothetical protein JOZ19_04095 [Rubrobacter sp.]|nr:hypothetical protein [Rubrobacter sp.]
MFPRWVGLLLIIGAVLAFLGVIWQIIFVGVVMIAAAGLAWLGVALLSGKGASEGEPSLVTQASRKWRSKSITGANVR